MEDEEITKEETSLEIGDEDERAGAERTLHELYIFLGNQGRTVGKGDRSNWTYSHDMHSYG